MQRVQITEYHQDNAARFERDSGLDRYEFACEDAPIYPGLVEALLWVACFAMMLMLCAIALGADVFNILRLVA